jgi:branched-chain amino acid transport system substrate-binding protein
MANPNAFPSRRSILRAGLGGATALAGLSALPSRAQSEPIRIGCLNSFSKNFALLGKSNLDGMNLAFEEVGFKVAGRKVELVVEDDEVNPQAGLQKIRKLVESDKVDMVCGPQASNVAMAVLGYMKQQKALLIVSGAGSTALTSTERIPNLYRTSVSSWQISTTMANWLYQNVAKSVFLSASDFSGGRDVMNEFKAAWAKVGGQVVGELYPPLGTNDFSSYLGNIKASGAPATYNFYAGSDATRFVNQYTEFQLKDKMVLTGYASIVDADTLPGQGKNALGCITGNIYSESLDNPVNVAFVAAYMKKYGNRPNLYSEYGYTTAKVIIAALQAAGGDVSDKVKFATALGAVHLDAPRGPFRFDPETHNPIQNVYVFEAVEKDGRVQNAAKATVKDVTAPGKSA